MATRPLALVADVDPGFRATVCRMLVELGFSSVDVGDGTSAQRLLHDAPTDVVCLDVALPALSGLELVSWMRTRRSLRNVPALFISSRAHPQDHAEVLRLGPSAFVRKPALRKELAAALKSLLPRALQ